MEKKERRPVGRPRKNTDQDQKITASRITDLRAAISKELYKEIEFSFFAPSAKDVKVAGSFTDWNKKPIKLKSNRDGKWQTTVKLKPGTYEYRFLVDGQWANDQRPVEMRQNEFGSTNCVLGVTS
ncbi:MAG: glycogen-binding domain-containing protein [Candidatus Omnitrophica bacterium]|nr:glycogen-binding domain-containing protein [Candidatus Omnitrophota bacterium]